MDIRQDDANHNSQPNQSGPRPAGSSSSGIAGAVIAILVLIIAAGVIFYFVQGDESGDAAEASYDGAVATVNGEEVAGAALAQQINSLRNGTSTQSQQFKQLSENRQEAVILEGLINTKLQVQAAEDAGASVSDEEVETQLQNQIGQIGEDTFQTRLEETGLTRQEVRDDLRNQLTINTYIQQQAGGEISATDEEIQTLYDQYTAQIGQQAASSSANLPALSDVRPQLEQVVLQQKRQQIASELLAQARQSADVEVLLDGVSYPASTSTPAVNQGTESPVETSATETPVQ